MSVRISFSLDLSISENSYGNKELGQLPWKGLNDQQANGGSWKRKLAAGVSNAEIDLNGLSNGRFIAIKSTQDISIKKNASTGEAWTIKALGVGALDGIFFCTTDGVTKLFLTNAGSKDADVTIVVAGDEA
jgi:hypothetical protein